MEEENIIVGVDVGASKICGAVGEVFVDGSIKIRGFVERTLSQEDEALRDGEIENGLRISEILNMVLEELAEKVTIDLSAININISNADIQQQTHKGRITKAPDNKLIEQSDVDKLLDEVRLTFKPQPGRSILHCMPLDFTVNDAKAGEKIVGRFGLQVGGDFNFITTKTETLEKLYLSLNDVNVKTLDRNQSPIVMENVVLSTLADAFSLLDKSIDDKRNGVAIINIGAELMELGIIYKNSFRHFKCISLGGHTITQDLMSAFLLNFEEAEQLKKICGNILSKSVEENEVIVINRREGLSSTEISLKSACKVVEWRLKELAAVVKTEIIRAGFEGLLTNGLILTGGVASMGIIKDVFVEITGVRSIRRGKPSKQYNLNGFDDLNKSKYSTLLGLLQVSNIPFDNRVKNSKLLNHGVVGLSGRLGSSAEKINTSTYKTSKPIDPPAKKPMLERFKNFIKNDSLNDDYN